MLPGVTAIEIDSEAEFGALKHQYAGDIERFLETLSSNFDLTFDREVLERTLDLSPPGLDEVMGLTRVMALLASGEFDIVVLDSAATGHLIRLLELPDIIDQWLKAFFALFSEIPTDFQAHGVFSTAGIAVEEPQETAAIAEQSGSIRALRGQHSY